MRKIQGKGNQTLIRWKNLKHSAGGKGKESERLNFFKKKKKKQGGLRRRKVIRHPTNTWKGHKKHH